MAEHPLPMKAPSAPPAVSSDKIHLPRRMRSPALLLAFAIVAILLWGFFHLAAEMEEGDTRLFDAHLLLALRHADDPTQPLGPQWLQIAARDLTSLGSITLLCMLAVAVFGYLLLIRRPASALLIFVALTGGLTAMPLLKSGFDRPRPDLVPHGVEVYTQSFPSGHAMLSAITYLTLGAIVAQSQKQRRVAIYVMAIAILLTVLIGSSRVYLAVHWPSDVLAGWCVGASWALLCWSIAFLIERRRPSGPNRPAGRRDEISARRTRRAE
jgi:undecaprenyl-diphosphatase